jgi:cell division protein FtsA
MDVRIGYPNEHLAGDSEDALSSPAYATAVGLLIEGLKHEEKGEQITQESIPEIVSEAKTTTIEKLENAPKVVENPTPKMKSFLEKFTDRFKDFLDNAE